jgi:RNA polymerase sigma factor (sigma-70 family)
MHRGGRVASRSRFPTQICTPSNSQLPKSKFAVSHSQQGRLTFSNSQLFWCSGLTLFRLPHSSQFLIQRTLTIFEAPIRLHKGMEEALNTDWMKAEQDQRISDAVKRERGRLRNFIRRRVRDEADAEDILQDVFYELVETYRLMKPVEQVSAWLFRVARNRIIDLFRKRKPETLESELPGNAADGESLTLEDLLPSRDAGPEAEYARSLLLDELDAALDELPEEQREVFVAHEIEGRSFKDLAAESGLSVNTLLSRKHYAVLHLRERLQEIYDEFRTERRQEK